jgi:multiple sugar transport system substrate-binding protein
MSTAPLSAQDLSGELVILQWEGGVEAQIWADLESAFMERHPDVSVRELVVTGQGDMRGAMRTALLGGEVVDIIINTWPAFRAELADAGIIRPIDEEWEEYGWSAQLSPSWRDLGSYGGDTYGLTYTYGNRSGLWYKTEHLENAGIEPPATWEEFLASFETLQGAGYGIPVAIGAKYWAHAEWFETLLARTAGVEALTKLASREMAWTDPAVKGAFRKFAEMLEAGCCGCSAGMFANDDGLADALFSAGQQSGDRVWRMPMGEAYDKIMDSQVADMRNSASRDAGSITAACFLGRFVEEGVKWAHLDVAGMVWADKAGSLYDKGATGFGVALLDRYIAANHES